MSDAQLIKQMKERLNEAGINPDAVTIFIKPDGGISIIFDRKRL